MAEKSITFKLTEQEIKILLNYKGVYWAPCLILLMPLTGTIGLIKMPNNAGIFTFLLIITIFLYIFTLYAFFSSNKIKNELKERLEKEQKINLDYSNISFSFGCETFTFHIHDIKRIKKTKYFYRVEFNFNKGDSELYQIPIEPNIPRNVISEQEMESLAAELKIKFK